jgi:hypothetical protein
MQKSHDASFLNVSLIALVTSLHTLIEHNIEIPIDWLNLIESLSGWVYGGTKSQDSFWAKIRQNSTVQETRGYPFRYTCAGV